MTGRLLSHLHSLYSRQADLLAVTPMCPVSTVSLLPSPYNLFHPRYHRAPSPPSRFCLVRLLLIILFKAAITWPAIPSFPAFFSVEHVPYYIIDLLSWHAPHCTRGKLQDFVFFPHLFCSLLCPYYLEHRASS